MKLSRKGIEWIYFNDDEVTKVLNTEELKEIQGKYSMCLEKLFKAIKNGENEKNINELCFKLDECNCNEVAFYELEGYIKGFEMCMKMMQGE